jgi:hypothetical protein
VAAAGFRCARCGEWHDELPMAFTTAAPAYWEQAGRWSRLKGVLGEEQCEIDGHRFVRARIVLPVRDAPADFEWGVWVSLSEESYRRTGELWEQEGRESEPPYFAFIQSEFGPYPSTLNLHSWLYTQPVGERPLAELEPTRHPLAREQREGIDMARVHELAAAALHPQPVTEPEREWVAEPELLRGWLERAAAAGNERARAELEGY